MPKKPPKPPKAPPRTPDPAPNREPSEPVFQVNFGPTPEEARTLLAIVPGGTYWGEPMTADETRELLRADSSFKHKLRLVLLSELAANDRRVGTLAQEHQALSGLMGEFSKVVYTSCSQSAQRIAALEEQVRTLEAVVEGLVRSVKTLGEICLQGGTGDGSMVD